MSGFGEWGLSVSTWTWWILGAVLLGLELLTGTTYLLWVAAASFATGVAILGFDAVWQVQLLIFAMLAVGFTVLGRRVVKPGMLKSDSPGLNEGLTRVAGRTAVALADFTAGSGRVKLDDTVWPARTAALADVAKGQTVRITGLEGATLVCEPAAPPG